MVSNILGVVGILVQGKRLPVMADFIIGGDLMARGKVK